MKKLIAFFFCLSFIATCFSEIGQSPTLDPKLNVNNIVLTKVNGKNISVIDVMKKMDFIFHKNYPQMVSSKQAKYQFYSSSWKHVLNELVNTELMLAQAESKEVKVHDSEVREEMENRFGPNTLITLENVGLTYDEAFQMIKTEMIVQRMMWFFVQSKAMAQVTPQMVKQEYRQHLEKNPPYDEWDYQVLSVKGVDEKEIEIAANKAYELLKDCHLSLDEMSDKLKDLEKEFQATTLQISSSYTVTSKDVSATHKEVLTTLHDDSFSAPIAQTSRYDNKKIQRIFYLKKHGLKTPPPFEEMSDNIRQELLQKVAIEESDSYFSKLRKYYGISEEMANIPNDFMPFSIE
jgi:hypothetical protein